MRDVDPFYKTKRWKAKREKILRRDGYQCQVSRRFGKMREANTVHHIFPREQYPEYQWEDWNLIAVSQSVHGTLHDRTTKELTEIGYDLAERTARRRNIAPPYRNPPGMSRGNGGGRGLSNCVVNPTSPLGVKHEKSSLEKKDC